MCFLLSTSSVFSLSLASTFSEETRVIMTLNRFGQRDLSLEPLVAESRLHWEFWALHCLFSQRREMMVALSKKVYDVWISLQLGTELSMSINLEFSFLSLTITFSQWAGIKLVNPLQMFATVRIPWPLHETQRILHSQRASWRKAEAYPRPAGFERRL